MQTTAIGTVTNSLPQNEVILLTLLISGRYISYTDLDNNFIITNKVITNNIIVNVDFLSNPTYISYQAMGLYSQFLTK